MTPYFAFPKGKDSNKNPGTNSENHPIATQAALLHYARVPPGYQHVYLIGSPVRPQTNDRNIAGGDEQKNKPHYAEIIAALAALDFFSLPSIANSARELHFANTVNEEASTTDDKGVLWETLPVHLEKQHRQNAVKRRLVAFTTFAYFYKNFLHQRFASNREYKVTNWYRHNFSTMTLDDQSDLLNKLYKFVTSYLDWIRQIDETGDPITKDLFNWEALKAGNLEQYGQYLGNLMRGNDSEPKYMKDSYDKIWKKLDGIKLSEPGVSATGQFIYLVYEAVMEFCRENYSWQKDGLDTF